MRCAGVMLRMVLFVCALGLLIGAAWIGSHAVYHSWHPCDWLLQDTVERVLERRGVDPDTASIPLKAGVSEAPEVQIVLRLRRTPLECVSTWAAGRIFPCPVPRPMESRPVGRAGPGAPTRPAVRPGGPRQPGRSQPEELRDAGPR